MLPIVENLDVVAWMGLAMGVSVIECLLDEGAGKFVCLVVLKRKGCVWS
jgi:hypothetical protein